MKCTDNYSDQTKAKINPQPTSLFFILFLIILRGISKLPFLDFFPYSPDLHVDHIKYENLKSQSGD